MGTNKSRVGRVDAQPAFILHQYPYRETSRLLEVFSRDHGRVVMVARGAQRHGSQLRAVLLDFQPVMLAWFGDGEVKTLHAAEWQGGIPQLSGLPLLCGFYLNELLMRLLPRAEANPSLFSVYYETIRDLAFLQQGNLRLERTLRLFERQLVQETGYGVDWGRMHDGSPVESHHQYSFLPGTGIVSPNHGLPVYDGEVLLAFLRGELDSEMDLAQAKSLMRQALGAILGNTPLYTRQLLLDLQKV